MASPSSQRCCDNGHCAGAAKNSEEKQVTASQARPKLRPAISESAISSRRTGAIHCFRFELQIASSPVGSSDSGTAKKSY
jgi:hypothetical protein